MHGIKETSITFRLILFAVHTIFLCIAYMICFDNRFIRIDELLGVDFNEGNIYRKSCLLIFGLIMYIRMNITALYLLKRKIQFDEFFGVITAYAIYQIGFVLLGAWNSSPFDSFDYLGILLFISGSYINTFSEIQRRRFKKNPLNNGKLYTLGLFKFSRHINYFGDICWVTGWAIISHNLWASLIPILLTFGFIYFFIPELSQYLEKNYTEEYVDWKKHTRKLIPFIY